MSEGGERRAGRRPRILRFRRALNSRGGIERLLAETSAGLVERGFDPTIVSREIPADYPRPHGVELRITPQVLTPIGSLSPSLLAQVVRTRPHVVEVHGLNSNSALAHLTGPWVRLLYSYFHPERAESAGADELRKRIKVAHRWADAFVLMTEEERGALEDFTGDDFSDAVVVSPGADWEPSTVPEAERDTILVVCRLEEAKRVDVIIGGAAKAGRLSHVRVVGHGDDHDRLAALVVANGEDPAKVLRGRITDEELQDLFGHARVLVSMSESESYGITLAEGLAAGLPVVASDIPPHRSILSTVPADHFRIVPLGDEAALAAVLREPPAMPPPGLLQRSWSTVADDLDALYRRLSAGKLWRIR